MPVVRAGAPGETGARFLRLPGFSQTSAPEIHRPAIRVHRQWRVPSPKNAGVMMSNIGDILFTWNERLPAGTSVEIEDDTLRDGLQASFIRKPTVEEKAELFRMSAGIGARHAVVGFPASSPAEFSDSRRLLSVIRDDGLPLMPWFLGRAVREDLEPMLRLRDHFGADVGAAFFIGTSPIRRHVEKWDMAQIMERITGTMEYLEKVGLPFSFSVEDASRTPPDELRDMVELAVRYSAYSIAVCDTVGESTPAGVHRLVGFVKSLIKDRGSHVKILWHGHNDRGLGLANSIAAVEAGADIVGGAFLGIGERSGNTALEQVIMYLYQNGVGNFDVKNLIPYLKKLSAATEFPIPVNMPLVGQQAFATCTGTHAAAVLKAAEIGTDFEDYVFSSIPASELGAVQDIGVGPTSGMANATYVLRKGNMDSSEGTAEALLAHAKTQHRLMYEDEIVAWYKQHAAKGS
ncbi:LeuA family protein [Streptomyces achromogenes]